MPHINKYLSLNAWVFIFLSLGGDHPFNGRFGVSGKIISRARASWLRTMFASLFNLCVLSFFASDCEIDFLTVRKAFGTPPGYTVSIDGKNSTLKLLEKSMPAIFTPFRWSPSFMPPYASITFSSSIKNSHDCVTQNGVECPSCCGSHGESVYVVNTVVEDVLANLGFVYSYSMADGSYYIPINQFYHVYKTIC